MHGKLSYTQVHNISCTKGWETIIEKTNFQRKPKHKIWRRLPHSTRVWSASLPTWTLFNALIMDKIAVVWRIVWSEVLKQVIVLTKGCKGQLWAYAWILVYLHCSFRGCYCFLHVISLFQFYKSNSVAYSHVLCL